MPLPVGPPTVLSSSPPSWADKRSSISAEARPEPKRAKLADTAEIGHSARLPHSDAQSVDARSALEAGDLATAGAEAEAN